MEGIIKVTPEQLQNTSNEFAGKGTTVGNLTSQMTDLVVGLSSVWEGEAASAYVAKFRQLDDDIQKMIRMIQEHSTDLNEMAQAYIDAENANADAIATLSGDVIV